jgi:hypothetical protein
MIEFTNVYGFKERISKNEYLERIKLYYTYPSHTAYIPEKYRRVVSEYNRPEFIFANMGVMLDYCISTALNNRVNTGNTQLHAKTEIDWKKHSVKYPSNVGVCAGCAKFQAQQQTKCDQTINVKD